MMIKTKQFIGFAAAGLLACSLTAGIGLVSAQAEDEPGTQTPENLVASADGWDTPSASWSFTDGKATGTGVTFLGDFALMDYQADAYNYTLKATFEVNEGAGIKEIGFGIVPWAQDENNFIVVSMKWTTGTPFSVLVQRKIGGIWYGAEGNTLGSPDSIPWNEVQFAGTDIAAVSFATPVNMTVQKTYNATTGMDDYITTIEGRDANGQVISTTYPVQSFSQSAGSGGKIGLYTFNHPIDITSFTAELGEEITYKPYSWYTQGNYHIAAYDRDDVSTSDDSVTMTASESDDYTRFYISSASSEAYDDVTVKGSVAVSGDASECGLYLNYTDDENNLRLEMGADNGVTLISEAKGATQRWTGVKEGNDFSVHYTSGFVSVSFGGKIVAFTGEDGAPAPSSEGAVPVSALDNFDSVNFGAYTKGGTLTVSGISMSDTFDSYTPLQKGDWTVYGVRANSWSVAEDGTVTTSIKGNGDLWNNRALQSSETADPAKGYFVGAQVRVSEKTGSEWKYGLIPYFQDTNNYFVVWLSQWSGAPTTICIYAVHNGAPVFTTASTFFDYETSFTMEEMNYLEVEVLQSGDVNIYLNRSYSPTASVNIAPLAGGEDGWTGAAQFGLSSFNVAAEFSNIIISEERPYSVHNEVIITLPASFPTEGTVGKTVNLGVITASLEGDGGIAPTPVITVTDPDGAPVQLDGVRFTPDKAGTYTVTITATDSWGNSATETREIVVTESGDAGQQPSEGEPLSGGAIAGIVIAGVVVVAAAVVAVVLIRKRKSK